MKITRLVFLLFSWLIFYVFACKQLSVFEYGDATTYQYYFEQLLAGNGWPSSIGLEPPFAIFLFFSSAIGENGALILLALLLSIFVDYLLSKFGRYYLIYPLIWILPLTFAGKGFIFYLNAWRSFFAAFLFVFFFGAAISSIKNKKFDFTFLFLFFSLCFSHSLGIILLALMTVYFFGSMIKKKINYSKVNGKLLVLLTVIAIFSFLVWMLFSDQVQSYISLRANTYLSDNLSSLEQKSIPAFLSKVTLFPFLLYASCKLDVLNQNATKVDLTYSISMVQFLTFSYCSLALGVFLIPVFILDRVSNLLSPISLIYICSVLGGLINHQLRRQ